VKIGIFHKLFFAVLATVVLAVGLVSVASRWSFTHGFLGYLNEQAAGRMEFVAERVREAYAQHGNWDFMHDRPEAWFELVRPVVGQELTKQSPPGSDIPTSDLTGAFLRIGLVDAQMQWVAGYRDVNAGMRRQPVLVGGETVGWVIVASFQSVTDAGNQQFQEEHLRAVLIASLLAVALAGFTAFRLTRALLSPIERVAGATHRLAAGEYDTRVSVASRDEIGQLANDFNHLAQTLQRNEHMRRDFMADVSHELRTPLAILRGELEAMDDGIRPLTPEALRSLQGEVGTLSKLVDDLYELSLSDAGALAYRRQPLDLRDSLRQAVDGMRNRLAQHSLELELDLPATPLPVNADEARLQQLFLNLMENTLRYTDAGGHLCIAAHVEAGRVRIDWQDSTPGVAADQLPQLFERFFRGEGSRNRATGGSGLGLAICRNIVEAHDGEIDAQASPLGGLWISIGLPTA
jgi:two-component system sensor histidine kinase BaeS